MHTYIHHELVCIVSGINITCKTSGKTDISSAAESVTSASKVSRLIDGSLFGFRAVTPDWLNIELELASIVAATLVCVDTLSYTSKTPFSSSVRVTSSLISEWEQYIR